MGGWQLTDYWADTKAAAAAGKPAVAGTAAGAGGTAIGAVTGFLTANPILAMIAAELGTQVLGRLFGGTSPFEQAAGQQLGATGALLPQLQRQAAGLPTAATAGQMRQIGQAQTRAQQSYAASAQRAGIAGTTPARAQQGRLQAAGVEAMGGILGQAQLTAQQQLIGLRGQAMTAQQQIEMQELQARQQFMSGLGAFMAMYRQNKGNALWEEMFGLVRDSYLQQRQVLRTMMAREPTAPRTRFPPAEPSPFTP